MTLLLLAIVTPLVPIIVLYRFAHAPTEGRVNWLVNVLVSGGVIIFFYQVGTWVFLSYYLRYVLLAVFAVIAIRSYPRTRGGGAKAPGRRRMRAAARTVYTVLSLALATLVVVGHGTPGDAIDLAFPLRGGTYCVIQGGNNFVTNPFHNFVDSEYAMDIVRINRFGNRSTGVVPREAGSYEVWGDTVRSPCDGIVHATVDSVHDNKPPRANSIAPLGNHIIITTGDTQIILAHLMRGSVGLIRGDSVTTGQAVGRVGNSGYSNEPHLHVQALRVRGGVPHGEPRPVTFGGRFLGTNDLIKP